MVPLQAFQEWGRLLPLPAEGSGGPAATLLPAARSLQLRQELQLADATAGSHILCCPDPWCTHVTRWDRTGQCPGLQELSRALRAGRVRICHVLVPPQR